MSKVAELGMYLLWRGKLVEVVAIGEGKTIYMIPVGAKPCDKCGEIGEMTAIERSPLFQDNAEPVPTIAPDKTKLYHHARCRRNLPYPAAFCDRCQEIVNELI